MARPRKAQVEGAAAPEATQEGFAAYVARFKAEHPDEWEALRLCPLQHGLEDMARLLK